MKASHYNQPAVFVCAECGESRGSGGFCGHCGAELKPAGEDRLLGQSVGHYRIASLLGEGGMGRVYKAINPTIGSRVAIKVLSRDCADRADLVERFFSEARAVNLIRHESIVNVIDLDRLEDGRPFIVMEYLDGAPLADVLHKRGRLPLGTAARLLCEVLAGLAAAHAKTIVHRDLKPDNIFVSPQGRAKILDFGIAKLLPEMSGQATPTRTGSLMGTPHYMAPEQALAQAVDARADLYAVGVILFEAACGMRPFASESLFELLRKQIHDAPPRPSSLYPGIPPNIEAIILRALAKDPNQRFQSAEEFAQTLSQATENLPQEEWMAIGSANSDQFLTPMAPSLRSPMPAPRGTATPTPRPIGGGHSTNTPSAHGQLASPQPKSGKSMWPWALGAALLVAGGITFAVLAGGDSGEQEETQAAANESSSKDDEPAPKEPALTHEKPAKASEKPSGAKPDAKRVRAEADPPASDLDQAAREAKKKSPFADIDYTNFDISAFLPTAEKLAKEIYSDAKLFRIDAAGVLPSGNANLTLQDRLYVLYRFASPSRSGRPKDLPLGVDYKPNCMVYVNIAPGNSYTQAIKGWKCDDPLTGFPKKKVKEVWSQAIQTLKAPSKNAVAEVGYWAARNGKGRWLFTIGGTKISGWIKD